jgi:hypothetical protein
MKELDELRGYEFDAKTVSEMLVERHSIKGKS